MAIESSRQLLDPSKKATGYRFRDVSFLKALIVPPGGETVESQLYLRPLKEASGGFLTWSEFRICVYESSEWSDICRGCVAVEYEAAPFEVDDGKEVMRETSQYIQDHRLGSSRCARDMKSKELYEYFKSHGLEFGPSFQCLQNIRFNEQGESTGTVNLNEWRSKTSENKIRPHVIHPAALDSILHTTWPALSKGGKVALPTMVPTKIRQFWIAENDVADNLVGSEGYDQPTVNVYSKADLIGLRNAKSSFIALDAKSGKPRVIGELELTAVAGYNSMSTGSSTRKRICYSMDWKPDLDLMDNDQIGAYCSMGVDPPVPASKSLVEEKEMVCYLALAKVTGEHLHKIPLKEIPHLRKYLDWTHDQLSNKSSMVIPANLSKLANDSEYVAKLQETVERNDAEGRLIVRVARNLTRVLNGEVDALNLLFVDDLMDKFYRYNHQSTSAMPKLLNWVDAFAYKRPDIKILEIGGGTGGATELFINTLSHRGDQETGAPRFSEYVFTDISPSFFEDAKVRFSACSNRMSFSILNVEQDPQAQGFETSYFDLIIASNVLHATTSLKNTLENTRKLLKPGGKLVLYEYTSPEVVLPGFIFGLLPGWWLSTEKNRRSGPLLSSEDWDQNLSRSGFSGVDLDFFGLPEKSHHPRLNAMVTTAGTIQKPALEIPKTIIIVTEDSSLQSQIADQIVSSIKKTGASHCEVITLEKAASTDFDQATCVFLPELEKPFIYEIEEEAYATLKRITSTAHGLLWTTNLKGQLLDPNTGMVIGLARTIQAEAAKFRFITLALDEIQDPSAIVNKIWQVLQRTLYIDSKNCESEYAEINGFLCINRLVEANYLNDHVMQKTTSQSRELIPFKQDRSRRLLLTIDTPGSLDTLQFVDDTDAELPLPPDEVEVEVKSMGLNFKDVLIALGQTNLATLGVEYAGVVTKTGAGDEFKVGDRVCCFVDGSMRTYIRSKTDATVRIPDDMSFQDAAAFPVSYITAYFALMYQQRMRRGESVLIHSGAGGLGQASIQLAKLLDGEIFVTVGTEEKKQFLMDVYAIPEDHIFSSRTASFKSGINRMTHGRGVDVIVNSLSGEALSASWECVAPFGRFMELGKADILNSGSLSMFPFARGAVFTGIDLTYLLAHAPTAIRESLYSVMALFKAGKITLPDPIQIYNASQIEDAFRYLGSGKSKGKIVIDYRDEDLVSVSFLLYAHLG